MPAQKREKLDSFDGFFSDDESWSDAEVVSDDFGVKFKIGNGPKDIPLFIGRFEGTKTVVNEETGEEMLAAEFSDAEGVKHFCWRFYALNQVLEDDKLHVGDIVRMEFKGEAETKRGLNPVKVVEIKIKRPS